ncbi:hypothetical protein [Desulfovibrio sp. ZJ200]|uniref:hypothetical protein n=1 Tax=Desulfovibrio sp. ZJ200 TaxID=2709792 RepID=UPI0013ED7F8B|nr:hypothetical protein [Desulfovibrio sp. ZJ200]
MPKPLLLEVDSFFCSLCGILEHIAFETLASARNGASKFCLRLHGLYGFALPERLADFISKMLQNCGAHLGRQQASRTIEKQFLHFGIF